jgi:hypothetical protein
MQNPRMRSLLMLSRSMKACGRRHPEHALGAQGGNMQRDLFDAALDEIDRDGDLVNVVLELTLETALSDEIVVDRYALPTDSEG